MHLTSVDLPAPLSPTSAVTSPTVRFEVDALEHVTGPKHLLILRRSRIEFAHVSWPFVSSAWITRLIREAGWSPPRYGGDHPGLE